MTSRRAGLLTDALLVPVAILTLLRLPAVEPVHAVGHGTRCEPAIVALGLHESPYLEPTKVTIPQPPDESSGEHVQTKDSPRWGVAPANGVAVIVSMA